MKLALWYVGRSRNRSPLAEAAADYAKRLTRQTRFSEKAIRPAAPSLSSAEAMREESSRVLAALPANALLVLLDERGDLVRSEDLAQRVDRWRHAGSRTVVVCVGGADGHADELRQRADWVWSLSPLVLPHELARVVALEQLYRAFTILAGEPYHRA